MSFVYPQTLISTVLWDACRVLHVLTVRGCEEVETVLCISLKIEKDSDVSRIQ